MPEDKETPEKPDHLDKEIEREQKENELRDLDHERIERNKDNDSPRQ